MPPGFKAAVLPDGSDFTTLGSATAGVPRPRGMAPRPSLPSPTSAVIKHRMSVSQWHKTPQIASLTKLDPADKISEAGDDDDDGFPNTLAQHCLCSSGSGDRGAMSAPTGSQPFQFNRDRKYSDTGVHFSRRKNDEFQHRGVFVDADEMKAKVRARLDKSSEVTKEVYKSTGVWQWIARSSVFEYSVLGMIAFNALWIFIDTDYNKATMLLNSDPVFIAMENIFCFFFVVEWIVKVLAMRSVTESLHDRWFIFDTILVMMMVLETWVMTLVVVSFSVTTAGGTGSLFLLRIARLMRLTRMVRMARLLRAMPELMFMIKGMMAAMRSVFFTLCLLVILLYIFGIVFTQLIGDTTLGNLYFESVPKSMYTLLLYGGLLFNIGILSDELAKEGFFYTALFLFFVLLSALTVLNMLTGVLCEVVSAVAATEKEQMRVSHVHRVVKEIMAEMDEDGDGRVSKEEFLHLLSHESAVEALRDVGVDVVGLVDFSDHIFEEQDDGATSSLEFPEFMEIVLALRGSNGSTVKDIIELRKLLRAVNVENRVASERIEAQVVRLVQRFESFCDSQMAGQEHGTQGTAVANGSDAGSDEEPTPSFSSQQPGSPKGSKRVNHQACSGSSQSSSGSQQDLANSANHAHRGTWSLCEPGSGAVDGGRAHKGTSISVAEAPMIRISTPTKASADDGGGRGARAGANACGNGSVLLPGASGPVVLLPGATSSCPTLEEPGQGDPPEVRSLLDKFERHWCPIEIKELRAQVAKSREGFTAAIAQLEQLQCRVAPDAAANEWLFVSQVARLRAGALGGAGAIEPNADSAAGGGQERGRVGARPQLVT